MSDALSPDDAATAEVERVLQDLVRPLLERDGGGIELVSVRGAEVVVRLVAVCAGCPGASYTTETVIAPLIGSVVSGLSLKIERAP